MSRQSAAPPEMLAVVVIALIVLGIWAGIRIGRIRFSWRGMTWRKRGPSRGSYGLGSRRWGNGEWSAKAERFPPNRLDAADQLRVVMTAEYTAQSLLNGSEARVLKELERFVGDCDPRWRVMAQVSLGEILTSPDPAAYAAVNSKRVDLLLVDGDYVPRHAIEYQGSGHHQGSAAARDAVKKEALRRAGIGYHEVIAGQTTPAELRRLVERLVPKPTSGQ
ncbi:DUF2726 domain-containing protein [Roseococcus sp. SDR]|uniref:DUF2726 domain-containing protein n=1 Tax=Roseococcus sp. SDR TaxID=2835532 RepID=UPI001BCFD14E|nr:DUF2726 domain-containing protein [Roseococcus sp. SDR]MBS7792366.1 DUF2726 domain-containing protein [Roseococcus sp. SDR]MBV1847680.1 DUF2726 domain-containing protein [Roseococcus sp. SDR]